MKSCSCPWCPKPAEEGKESMMGQPTCADHSWEQTVGAFKKALQVNNNGGNDNEGK